MITPLLFILNLLYTALSIFSFAILLSIGFTIGKYLIAKFAPQLVMV